MNQLQQLEERLLEPAVRKDKQILNELLADDFVECGSDGNSYQKDQIIHGLSNELSPVKWSLSNFHVRSLAEDIALATYIAKKQNLSDGTQKLSSRCSIWKKSGEKWQMIFHQGTPIESKPNISC